jgi:hypothetical protein
LDEHGLARVLVVKSAIESSVLNAHQPIGVAKRIHSIAAKHRMKGRHAAIKRHPFQGVCEASGM